ncbi:MAG: alkylhydroperoxidase-related (seleno)protein [Chloroflexota bacterium]|nr:alkylhydroperoxidase-related (seleno)protein [Chloroflexota bacterium]
MYFDYQNTGVGVPDRFADAHQRAWTRLASPGMWWTSTEKIDIAAETRNAESVRDEYRNSLSPSMADPPQKVSSTLDESILEAIYRITTDPARLSRDWFNTLIERGVKDTHYVELVSVVTTVLSIDDFHRGIGIELEDLPTPIKGDPLRRRPTGARDEGSWVNTVPPAQLDPVDDDIYGGRDSAPNVIRALSLVPPEVRALEDMHEAQYLTYAEMGEFVNLDRSLSRAQIEFVAAKVSVANECFY